MAVKKECLKEGDGDKSKSVKHTVLSKARDDVDLKFYWDLAIGITSIKQRIQHNIHLITMPLPFLDQW